MSKKDKKSNHKEKKKHKEKENDRVSERKSKNKKSKKSKKSHKKDEQQRSDSDNISNNNETHSLTHSLTQLLSVGMVLFPQLNHELSGILMALDSGKQFHLLNKTENKNKFHSFLLKLFQLLPLKEESNNLWKKKDYTTNIRRYVMNHLLQSKTIIQPNILMKLSSETLVMNASNVILPLMMKYPTLWNDINPLLHNFIAGEAVDVSGIEIQEIKDGLCSFFQAIGAVSDGNDGGNGDNGDGDSGDENDDFGMTFMYPSKSSSGPYSGKTVRKAVQYFVDLFEFTKVTIKDLSIDVDISLPETIQDDSSSSSSSSSSEGDDSESDDDVEERRETIPDRKGPAMPTKAELALAAKLSMQNSSIFNDNSDDEDDDVGPGVVFKAPNSSSTTGNNLEERDPLGGVMVGGQSGGVEEEGAGPLSTSVPGEGTEKLQREEWMLTPGERMPFGGDPTDPTMPSNRKFERGKLAKKSAEAIAAQREAEYERYMNSEEGKEAEAVLEEYRKKRGPTLMEKHTQDVASKRAKSGTTAMSELRKKGFDRERDMSSHRQMGTDQAKKLIEEAKNLDSRFSKSYARK